MDQKQQSASCQLTCDPHQRGCNGARTPLATSLARPASTSSMSFSLGPGMAFGPNPFNLICKLAPCLNPFLFVRGSWWNLFALSRGTHVFQKLRIPQCLRYACPFHSATSRTHQGPQINMTLTALDNTCLVLGEYMMRNQRTHPENFVQLATSNRLLCSCGVECP